MLLDIFAVQGHRTDREGGQAHQPLLVGSSVMNGDRASDHWLPSALALLPSRRLSE